MHEEEQNEVIPPQFGPVIPWEGGDCPVHPDTPVRFIYRDGKSGEGLAIPGNFRKGAMAKYANLIWHHAPMPARTKPENDIIAYQVLHG